MMSYSAIKEIVTVLEINYGYVVSCNSQLQQNMRDQCVDRKQTNPSTNGADLSLVNQRKFLKTSIHQLLTNDCVVN